MHAVFMLHGKKELVDRAIKWLETRLFYLPFENKNLVKTGPRDSKGNILKKGYQPIVGVLRYGLFGTWEFVFPENYKDEVLTTLGFNKEPYKKHKLNVRLLAIRKALKLSKIPKFKTDKQILLPEGLFDNISIIPIGIRYDVVGEMDGLTYELL